MGGILKDRWSAPSIAVAHEFIDGYMASANGEYVKVYLYVLRHQGEVITIERIADALNHTESDVRRALLYWEKQGILVQGEEMPPQSGPVPGQKEGMSSRGTGPLTGNHDRMDGPLREQDLREHSAMRQSWEQSAMACVFQEPIAAERKLQEPIAARHKLQEPAAAKYGSQELAAAKHNSQELAAAKHSSQELAAAKHNPQEPITARQDFREQKAGRQSRQVPGAVVQDTGGNCRGARQARESTIEVREAGDMPVYSPEQVNRLSQDEAFSQLLYIAQKYMDRVFTPRDCQVFAYLYEDLGMCGELLEYLVEYCVQNGHTSVRYIEAVARNWHEKDIRTAQEAKDYSASYNKDSFAVMKAFGINSRKPAAPEQKLMDKWFREYGFTRDVVLEACNRTITAIHNPSFQYADKILGEWKKSDIRRMEDIREMDAKRLADKEQSAQSRDKRLQKYEAGVSQGNRTRKGAYNQFHNFEQRDTDYDALMLEQVKEWVGQ